jgi:hypothetical protein
MNTTGRISQRKINTAASTLPEIGRIKIGEKTTNASGKEYPRALDYFRPTGQFAQVFQTIYGNNPKKLSVAFISDNLTEVCNERYECWKAGKRWGWGDGNEFTVWDTTKRAYVECSAEDARVKALPWDLMLTLRFVLLEMKGIMGYWTFQTKAQKTTIPSIVQAFDFVREKAGTIIGFPFNLLVEKKTGYSPEDPKTYPVVTLVPNFSQESIEMISDYLEQGGNVNKITTAMIEQKKVLQIEAPKQNSAPTTPAITDKYSTVTNDIELIYELIDTATDANSLKTFYKANNKFFKSNPEAEQRLIAKGESLKS